VDRRGQITLEAVVILLILLSIYVGVTYPLGQMSHSGASYVSSAALGDKAVRKIVSAVDAVGVGGPGSRKLIQVFLPAGTTGEGLVCSDKEVSLRLALDNSRIDRIEGGAILGLDYSQSEMFVTLKKDTFFTIHNKNNCSAHMGRFAGGNHTYLCVENLGLDAASNRLMVNITQSQGGVCG
jgi:hypothetical protein